MMSSPPKHPARPEPELNLLKTCASSRPGARVVRRDRRPLTILTGAPPHNLPDFRQLGAECSQRPITKNEREFLDAESIIVQFAA